MRNRFPIGITAKASKRNYCVNMRILGSMNDLCTPWNRHSYSCIACG